MADTLDRLAATIAGRRGAAPDTSYVASLFAKGMPKIAQKLGEEGVETVIAALSGDRKAVASEAADLLFHLLVLLDAAEVPLADVFAELDRREGVSGHDEKAARRPAPTAVPPPRPIAAIAPPAEAPETDAEPPAAPALALGREKGRRPLIRKG